VNKSLVGTRHSTRPTRTLALARHVDSRRRLSLSAPALSTVTRLDSLAVAPALTSPTSLRAWPSDRGYMASHTDTRSHL